MDTDLNGATLVTPVAPPPAETETDLLRKLTVTRANAVEAEAYLRTVTERRDVAVREHDAKVAAARDALVEAHAAFRTAQQALITRVAVDPVASVPAPAWPGVEAVQSTVAVSEMPDDDDDYDAVLRAASGRA